MSRPLPPTLPARAAAMQSPVIPLIGAMVRARPGTISLGQGVVHYGPPPEAREQVLQFFDDPANHKYGPVEGIAPLVEVISTKLARENDITVGDDRRVMVTAGGNMAFLEAVLAITDPGDEVILLSPYYFNHEMAVVMAGCRPVIVATSSDYQPRLDALADAVTPRTRAILTVSPNNPTGAVYPEATLRAINALCRERGVYHITDEAYEYFTYTGAQHVSPGGFDGAAGHTISLFSLSKTYGFASWRIGYMVVPAHLWDALQKIQDTNLICPPAVSQWAAVGALQAGAKYCRQHLPALAAVRETALAALSRLGPRCVIAPPGGAFYLLLRLETRLAAMEVVERLIRDHSVAALPGTPFGLEGGCYLRISYGALPQEQAEEGIGRLVTGLTTILYEQGKR